MRPNGLWNPRPIVSDGQFYPIRRVASAYGDPDAAGLALGIAQGIAAQIPHYLVQMAAVERDRRIGIGLQVDHVLGHLLDLAELRHEGAQEGAHLEGLAVRAVA